LNSPLGLGKEALVI